MTFSDVEREMRKCFA